MNNISEPKYGMGEIVNGKRVGKFVIVGRRWSDVMGEYVYGVFQVNEEGRRAKGEMNLVESCFA